MATWSSGGAAALIAGLPGGSPPDALLAAGLMLAFAGLLDFISRAKKTEEAPPGGGKAEQGAVQKNGGAPPPAGPGADRPPGDEKPGGKKKGTEPPRQKPRRSDYKGKRVQIFVPGRQTTGAPGPPAATGPQAGPGGAAGSSCPGCGKPSDREGGESSGCGCERRVAEVADLIGSLKTREVNVIPAERYLFQARSALAVSAWEDVKNLVDRAETLARGQESDFEECAGILARCEEALTVARQAGRNTLAAEKALRRATLLFKEGRYTNSMEEAVLVPTLILDRPHPRIVIPADEVRAGPGIPDGSAGGTAGGAAGRAIGSGDAAPSMVRCPACGERVAEGTVTCPACGRPVSPREQEEWANGRSCLGCGESLEPGWKVCPACNTPVAGELDHPDGSCPSCSREVLPTWTVCPFCDARLRSDGEAMRVRKGFSRPERPAPEVPPEIRQKGVMAQIEEVDRLLDEAGRRDLDVRKARNLLELAVNFTRSGNYDKGERYVRKAKNVAETLLSID